MDAPTAWVLIVLIVTIGAVTITIVNRKKPRMYELRPEDSPMFFRQLTEALISSGWKREL